jgi:hypothetical protein
LAGHLRNHVNCCGNARLVCEGCRDGGVAPTKNVWICALPRNLRPRGGLPQRNQSLKGYGKKLTEGVSSLSSLLQQRQLSTQRRLEFLLNVIGYQFLVLP